MKKYFLLMVVLTIGLIPGFTTGEKITGSDMNLSTTSASVKLDVNFGKIPLYFISNNGQVHKKARFYAKASQYTLWLTKEGLVF